MFQSSIHSLRDAACDAGQTPAQRCHDALRSAGTDLAPVLRANFEQLAGHQARTAFACEVMAVFNGAPVTPYSLQNLADDCIAARRDGWAHIARSVATYIGKDATSSDTYTAGGRPNAAVSPTASLKSPREPTADGGAATDLAEVLAWPGRASGDYKLIMHCGLDRQSVWVNDNVTLGAMKCLFYVMTGVAMAHQSLTGYEMRAPTTSLRELRIGSAKSMSLDKACIARHPVDAAARDAFVETLAAYAEDDRTPAEFLTNALRLAGGTCDSPVQLMEVFSELLLSSPILPLIDPLMGAFSTPAARIEACEALRTQLDPSFLLTAAPALAMYLHHSQLSDAQRLKLVHVMCDSGMVSPEGNTLEMARNKIDALLQTVAALAEGSSGLGGQYLLNRLAEDGDVHLSDRIVDDLLEVDGDLLPVGLILGRSVRAVEDMRSIVELLQCLSPTILAEHVHEAEPKPAGRDVFSGCATVSGAQLIFRGLLDSSDAGVATLLAALRTDAIKARLGTLSPLMQAFALAQPKILERNLRCCEDPEVGHLLRNFPIRSVAARDEDQVNNDKVLRWVRASFESILQNPDNTRDMAEAWQDFRAYATHASRDALLREKLTLLIDAKQVDGPPPPLPSEKLWQRLDGQRLPFTHVLGAVWNAAKRHGLQEALLCNLAEKVDLAAGGAPAHVWCHNGLGMEVGNCLGGWEEGVVQNPHESPRPKGSRLVETFYGTGLPLNGPETMMLRLIFWTAGERRFEGPEYGLERNDFEEFIDTHEGFLATMMSGSQGSIQ